MEKYIYKITNLINNKVYVGQTNDPIRREREHFSLTSSILEDNKNKILYSAMLKYGINNFSFEIIEDKTENYNEREKFWIKELNSLNPFGYNMTEGGEDPPHLKGENHPLSQHSLEEINQIKDLIKNTNLSFADISKQTGYCDSSIRRINKGQLWYDENSVYPLRVENTNQFKEDRKANIVYDLKYTKLTQKEIASKYGVSRTTVTAINRGQNYYNKDYSYPIRNEDCHSKPILMIDKISKEILKEFKNSKEAKEELKLPNRGDNLIRRCANGEIKTAYGYIWKFKY